MLMDLRDFSASNAGCIHELQHLVAYVPLDKCVLVVDKTTDEPFLHRILQQAWEEQPPDSPNRSIKVGDAPLYKLGPGGTPRRKLVVRLCEAAENR